MIKQVWVTEDTPCTICHLCEDQAPEIFEVDDITSHVKEGADFVKNEQLIKDAASACPVEIIKYEE